MQDLKAHQALFALQQHLQAQAQSCTRFNSQISRAYGSKYSTKPCTAFFALSLASKLPSRTIFRDLLAALNSSPWEHETCFQTTETSLLPMASNSLQDQDVNLLQLFGARLHCVTMCTPYWISRPQSKRPLSLQSFQELGLLRPQRRVEGDVCTCLGEFLEIFQALQIELLLPAALDTCQQHQPARNAKHPSAALPISKIR